jgi:hypothetical protein
VSSSEGWFLLELSCTVWGPCVDMLCVVGAGLRGRHFLSVYDFVRADLNAQDRKEME